MQVLIVSQNFWPENFRINDLALGLLERGHAVTVFTGMPNYPIGRFFDGFSLRGPYRQNYHGVEVIRVPVFPRGKGGGPRIAVNYFSYALSASLFAPFRLRAKYDVIIVYEPSPVTVGIPARVVKALKGTPILFWVQDLWPESLSATGAISSPAILGAVAQMVRWLYRGSDRILVQSRAFIDSVAKLAGSTESIRYFPNSAESFYCPVELEKATDVPSLPSGFRVMMAGNIGAAQDFDTVLKAAELLRNRPDIQWLLVGDGRQRAWVEDQILRRGLQTTVHLLGSYPSERMPQFFAHANALLVTLRRDPIFASTIPSKVQSYMACGRPIVAALDGEGARVIQESAAGLVGPSGDPAALAAAITQLAEMDEAERTAMGRRGRQYFELHFEREMLLDRLEGWMDEVVRERNA